MKNEIKEIHENLYLSMKNLSNRINQFISKDGNEEDVYSVKSCIHRVRSELWNLETLLNDYNKEDENV